MYVCNEDSRHLAIADLLSGFTISLTLEGQMGQMSEE